MRSFLIASVLLVATSVSAAPNSPFLRLEQTNKSGKVQLAVKNVSQKPVVAYVVVVESPDHRSVFHGVYTGKDALAAGQSAAVGEVAALNDQVRAFVDYVRLADGTTWGDAATDDAKEISARFQQ
ncbi:MAG: hypothetical protein WB421_07580 [Terriglobales bacterium]